MKLTYSKLKILDSAWYSRLCSEIGEPAEFQQELADRLGVDRRIISNTLNGNITSQKIQEGIAAETGIPVGRLFGDNAWFRVAARKLKELQAADVGA